MINIIWLFLLIGSVAVGLVTSNLNAIANSVATSASEAFRISLGLTGVMCLWLGMMKIAEKSGLVEKFSSLISPLLQYIFPDIPKGHRALGSISMNFVANMLGLSNAATPLGIKAMKDLQSLNEGRNVASDSMCMFLALNTSSLQLIPAGAIALLAAGGSSNPTIVTFPALLATTASTLAGFFAARMMSRFTHFQE